MIIDAHNHADWLGHNFDRFMENMDRRGINKTILLTWISPADEFSPNSYSILNISDDPVSFERCLSYVERAPDRFLLGYCPDPRRPDAIGRLKAAVDIYGTAVCGELKLRMMYDNPDAIRLYRYCGEAGLPVILHLDYEFSSGRDYPRPSYWYGGGVDALERALILCPDTNFLGHASGFWSHISGDGMHDKQYYPKGPVARGGKLIQLMEEYPNLYCDISGFSGANAFTRDLDFAKSFFMSYQDRICYGRDCFDNTHQELITSLGLPEGVVEKVYSQNILKLMRA